ENNEILLNAVSELVRDGLSRQDCKAAAYYGSLYEIPLNEPESFALFNCLYENKQYTPALNIAKAQVESAKDTKDKEKWLYHLAWVEFMQNNYPKAALAARDALMLLSDEKYNDSAWVLFMALHKQGNNKEAFKILPTLEEKLKDDNKMIEVYYATLQDALERRDDTAIKVYAKKLMDLQELHKRYEYSPFVELGFAQALSRENDFNTSLEMLNQAESRANTQEEKIQIYYLQGYLYTKLNDTTKAVESYEKCENIEAQSSWKNLCVDAKNLLKKD
ncbi:MAG: flagellar functional protein, partial [Helicobacter sp.]|nr:flagellar functional protein [Helicobacter sp.]